jgi:ABC-type molybdate transport system substrate-binding protein
MGRIRAILAGLALAMAAVPAGAMPVVAVDPGFAPVASVLVRLFQDRTGQAVELTVGDPAVLAGLGADVLLASDAALPARLAETGQAAADSLMTYATDPAARGPRDAVLLAQAAQDPVARAFLAFLITPEAWDIIVAHGFGAH